MATTQLHTALAGQLAAVSHDELLHCQTTAGDCLISVAERRDELVGKHYLNSCRDPEPEKQGSCIAHELEQRGLVADLASFYEMENWCSRELLECTAALASDATHQAARKRIQDRRAQIEADPKSVAAASEPEFVKDKLAFVRSTLPPPAQAACTAEAKAACSGALNAPRAQFEAELAKDSPAYDPERALALYAALHQAEADCHAPELTCLTGLLSQYGATPESGKLLQQNLNLLTKQQQTRLRIDADAAEQCLSAGVTQFGDRIVSAYQTYARDSGAVPFVRLQKAFLGMHQVQLDCLTNLSKHAKH